MKMDLEFCLGVSKEEEWKLFSSMHKISSIEQKYQHYDWKESITYSP